MCVDGKRAKIESYFSSFPCLADLHFRLRFNDTLVEQTGPLLKTELQKSKCFGTHQMVANHQKKCFVKSHTLALAIADVVKKLASFFVAPDQHYITFEKKQT